MAPNDPVDRLRAGIQRVDERLWEAVFVAFLGVFMLFSRLKTFDAFNQSEDVWFFGTDAYYHARQSFYTTVNFPRTLDYDAMTQYPLGTSPGQFGTLFDQLAAAIAWLAGLVSDGGAPSMETFLDVMTAYPALLGALSIVPIYLLARDLYGREPALFAGVITALLAGSFFVRTTAGFSDHHSIEIVLSTLTVWAAHRAFQSWEAEDLELEGVLEDPLVLYRSHRRALATSLLAGLAFWAYLAAWPPGVLFVGIVALWLVLQTGVEVVRGEDPVDLIVTGVTVFGFLAVLMLPYAIGSPHGGFSALNFTWMQPVAPLLAALGLAGLGVLAWQWTERELPARAYPLAALGVGLLGLGLLWVLLPSLVEQALSGTSWITGIGVDPTRRTIREAQPAEFAQLGQDFGLLYITAGIGFLLAIVGLFTKPERRTNTLILVWAALATSGTFTQSRFLYYLAVAVIVLNAYLARRLLDAAQVYAEESAPADADESPDWSGAHTLVVVFLVFMLFPTNVSGFFADCRGSTNAWTTGDCFGGPGESKVWSSELDWVRENTAKPPVGLTDSFERPESDRYEYPEGMYGVLSWWDYGHQIQFDGRRAPIANPFQQQAPLASEVFTADNETEALSLLDDYLGEDNEARYLMIDDAMVSTKFGAITVWAGVSDTYHQGEAREFPVEGRDQPLRLQTLTEEARTWFLQDVYHNDGSGMSHFRLVKEHPQFTLIGNSARISEDRVRITGYNTFLQRGPWQQFANLEQERAYPLQGGNRLIYDAQVGSRLKTYERVEGAHLVGQAEPGTNVTASLQLEASSSGRPFTYELTGQADEEGRFELVVPYSTSDDIGPANNGTRQSVHAQGPYELTVGGQTHQVQVPEDAVLSGGTVQVDTS